MRLPDAVDMLRPAGLETLGPATWADLGSGDGAFTLALAEVLPEGSVIHAIDTDAAALQKIPRAHEGVGITTHRGDFTINAWPFDDLDGILMANSLHYVGNQTTFVRACEARMKAPRRWLVVEYDTDRASRWLPYPVSRNRLTSLFADRYSSVRILQTRPSIYRRAALYAALIVE